MLLSSTPRSCTSRLAWLSQTPIAVASGRINQNFTISRTLYHLKYWQMQTDIHITSIPTSEPILHRSAFVDSPLKRPLTLLAEGYILLYCPSRADIPRPLAPDDSGSVWDNKVVVMSICSCRNESDKTKRHPEITKPCN